MEPTHDLMMGHNHAGILTFIENMYPKKSDIRHATKLSRKYFKDSRYSRAENLSVFTDDLADEFISYVRLIKNYVDNDCCATLEDLKKRFNKSGL